MSTRLTSRVSFSTTEPVKKHSIGQHCNLNVCNRESQQCVREMCSECSRDLYKLHPQCVQTIQANTPRNVYRAQPRCVQHSPAVCIERPETCATHARDVYRTPPRCVQRTPEMCTKRPVRNANLRKPAKKHSVGLNCVHISGVFCTHPGPVLYTSQVFMHTSRLDSVHTSRMVCTTFG